MAGAGGGTATPAPGAAQAQQRATMGAPAMPARDPMAALQFALGGGAQQFGGLGQFLRPQNPGMGTSSAGMPSGASRNALEFLMGRASAPIVPRPTNVPTVTGLQQTAARAPSPAASAPTTPSAPTAAAPAPTRTWQEEMTILGYAPGGEVRMQSGGFVWPADVVSQLGNGSSRAGLEVLAQHFGAQPLDGAGDGMSDDIPASVDGAQRAAVAREEAYMSPEQVRAAGGARKLYDIIDRVRKQAHGKTAQQRPVNPGKVLS
jgi:hypothetical protein